MQKAITFGRFRECLERISQHSVVQRTLQSKNHVNRMMETRKVAFDSYDSKRFALCPVHTCPYGSVLIDHYWKHVENTVRRCFFCAFDLRNVYHLKNGGGDIYLPHLADPRPDWMHWLDHPFYLLDGHNCRYDWDISHEMHTLRKMRRGVMHENHGHTNFEDEEEFRSAWSDGYTPTSSTTPVPSCTTTMRRERMLSPQPAGRQASGELCMRRKRRNETVVSCWNTLFYCSFFASSITHFHFVFFFSPTYLRTYYPTQQRTKLQ